MTHVTVLIEEDHTDKNSLFLPRKTRMARLALPQGKKLDTVRIGCEDGSYMYASIMKMEAAEAKERDIVLLASSEDWRCTRCCARAHTQAALQHDVNCDSKEDGKFWFERFPNTEAAKKRIKLNASKSQQTKRR